MLNTYENSEFMSKKKYYELHNIDLEPYEDENGEFKIPFIKSIVNL